MDGGNHALGKSMDFENLITFFGVDGMICHLCYAKEQKQYKTYCLDTRQFRHEGEDSFFVRRKHQCSNCRETFYTIENLEDDGL